MLFSPGSLERTVIGCPTLGIVQMNSDWLSLKTGLTMHAEIILPKTAVFQASQNMSDYLLCFS